MSQNMSRPWCGSTERGTIENLHYRLSSLRTELSALEVRILNDIYIVNMDEAIRNELRVTLPMSFGIIDFTDQEFFITYSTLN